MDEQTKKDWILSSFGNFSEDRQQKIRLRSIIYLEFPQKISVH